MNFVKMRNDARKLIKQNGARCVITRESERVYNPATAEYESKSKVMNGYAVLSNYTEDKVDGTIITKNDVRLSFVPDEDCLDSDPKENDKATFGGNEYTVIFNQPKKPDGKTIITDIIQARM